MKIIKNFINFFIYLLIKIKVLKLPKKSLRVLMFHNISDFDNFNKQINILKENWNFINVKDFYDMVEGKKNINGRNLLLTFDDGFKSNYHLAKNILKKLKLDAIFFVPLKFVLLKDKKLKLEFMSKNLKINNINHDMDNLDIKDLKVMKNFKFTIGSHTYSHINLNNINNTKKLKYEIIDSANKLEKLINYKIGNFSFNFGRLKDISIKSLLISKKRFRFIFTGIRGNNLDNKRLIFRDNIGPNDKFYDLYSYLSGYLDFLYEKERKNILSKFEKKNY